MTLTRSVSQPAPSALLYCHFQVGFFKRKRPEDMQMYQAEKKQQKILEEYEDEDA